MTDLDLNKTLDMRRHAALYQGVVREGGRDPNVPNATHDTRHGVESCSFDGEESSTTDRASCW
eukprot:6322247-Prorocentrum_lima.AAC.1